MTRKHYELTFQGIFSPSIPHLLLFVESHRPLWRKVKREIPYLSHQTKFQKSSDMRVEVDQDIAVIRNALERLLNTEKDRPPIDFCFIHDRASQDAARHSDETKASLSDLDMRFQALESMRMTIKDIRAMLVARSNYIRTTLAPISLLPPELIRVIFMHVLDAMTSQYQNTCKIVTALSGVSKAWRNIALSTSPLWTQIHIEWRVEQQELWLDRSDGRPVDLLLIGLLTRSGSVAGLDSIAVSKRIMKESARWRSLSAQLFRPTHIEAILEMLLDKERNLASLETLSFHNMIDDGYDRECIIPSGCSAIRCLRIHHSNMWRIKIHDIAENLVELDINNSSVNVDVWNYTIGSCSYLERLTLTDITYIDSPDKSEGWYQELVLPNLLHLLIKVKDENDEILAYAIAFIFAPRLQSLLLLLNFYPSNTLDAGGDVPANSYADNSIRELPQFVRHYLHS